MKALLVLGLVLVLVPVAQTTICSNYFSSSSTSQYQGVETLILNVISGLVADPVTAPYFNGQYGGTNFTAPANSALLNNLIQNLVAFFAIPLGCNADVANYTGNPNMHAVHNFVVPVNKAAFEHFMVIRQARALGIQPNDIYAIATVLDIFRTGGTSGPQLQICQDADCVTSPYTVLIADPAAGNADSPFFFNPPFMTVPSGFSVNYVIAANGHTVTEGKGLPSSPSLCSVEKGGFNSGPIKGVQGNSYLHKVTESAGTQINYFCTFHCPGAPMWGVLNVTQAIKA